MQADRVRICDLEGRLAVLSETLAQKEADLADKSKQLETATGEKVSLQQQISTAKQSYIQVQFPLAACAWSWSSDYRCTQGIGLTDRYVLGKSHFLNICQAALNRH